MGTDTEPRAERVARIPHPSVEERRSQGKALRKETPPDSHAKWKPAKDRFDPVALLEEQNVTREPDLVPVRHGRMVVSPFTFYRGAAKIMAADLKDTPRAGLTVQLCGDAHLSNFGVYASPERELLFDLNDFDETLPGPFEYDVKRLAASFVVAARNNGFSSADTQSITRTCAQTYCEAMAQFAGMGMLDIWYAHVSEDDLRGALRKAALAQGRKGAKTNAARQSAVRVAATEKALEKARTKDSLQALTKLAEKVDGSYRIVSQPPIVVPMRDIMRVYGFSMDELEQVMHEQFVRYRATLQHDRRKLLERFSVVDMARKVVGVGSVGTRCFIVLLQGRDEGDPLFLQAKEATRSVLEDHLPRSRYAQPGQRVVEGQRMMQAASDIFLGWTKGHQEGRFLYWRQLRDMKGSVDPEVMIPTGMTLYAKLCAWTVARAHARSGDPVAIAAYLGKGRRFTEAVVDFCERYADQNERDHKAFAKAIKSGRVAAQQGV